MDKRLLVVGARPKSLGAYVKQTAESDKWEVMTAGPTAETDFFYDAMTSSVPSLLETTQPRSIVWTAGVNDETLSLGQTFMINAIAPVEMLNVWASGLPYNDPNHAWRQHFVGISSNSARIPRSGSWAYCSSKAAMSMGIQCVSRSLAKEASPIAAYVYEPGWMEGTPMSRLYEEQHSLFNKVTPAPHRIPSGFAIDPGAVARVIVNNLGMDGRTFTGTCIRMDGGEI